MPSAFFAIVTPEHLLYYFIAINLVSVAVAAADKGMAVLHRRRVPESTLMLLGFLGGALGMWIVMKIIRHKTRKAKFMIGLPLMILLHMALAFVLISQVFHWF